MRADSWVQLLTEPALIESLYDSPPELSACALFYVHLDERADSVTLGFDTSHLPSHPRPEWQEKPFNAFEFHLEFESVSELRVAGWAAPARKNILLSAREDGGVRFSASAPGSLLEFAADRVRVARTRTYLASSAP